eukprot:TRINITY_DN122819_c0_g1_i1.p1 TRINITY_DN122819_c0_g1~~TRINITY_DN122819_c0_g1_i1.p1  ORF type:complete len:444 (+),score=73.68 TRINITY_DN122819_c0_g1_i1:73-1404(+)
MTNDTVGCNGNGDHHVKRRRTEDSGPVSSVLVGGRTITNQPGPTEVPDDVLRAMNQQSTMLEDERLHSTTASVMEDLKVMCGCAEGSEVFLHACNGHGMWDSVLYNTLSKGDQVLIVGSRFFGEQWARSVTGCELIPEMFPDTFTETTDLAAFRARLQADSERKIRAVLAVQACTLTGIFNDVEALSKAMREVGHEALLLVDAVCSFGVHPMRMEEWQVDAVLTGSQKGLISPPGLGIVCAGPRALERHRALKRPGEGLFSQYWDWTSRLSPQHYFKWYGTPPQQLLFALRKAMDLLHTEGIEHAMSRQRHCALAVRRAVEAWSAGPKSAISLQVPDESSQNSAVVVVGINDSIGAKTVTDFCRAHFDVSLAGAFGPMTGKAFRVATMGTMNAPAVFAILAALEATFQALKVPHGTGGLAAAVRYMGEVAATSGFVVVKGKGY